MRTPLPSIYMTLGSRRLKNWAQWCRQLHIIELPAPMSPEEDQLMEAFFTWEPGHNKFLDDLKAAQIEELEEASRLAAARHASQREQFNAELPYRSMTNKTAMRAKLAALRETLPGQAIAALNKAREDGPQATP